MTMESQVHAALASLAPSRVFPDFAPEGTARPYIVYQAVGGSPINFIGGEIPDLENTRVQISVWADTRLAASALGKQAEDAMRSAAALRAEVVTGRVATYDEETQYRGTRQDFSVWL